MNLMPRHLKKCFCRHLKVLSAGLLLLLYITGSVQVESFHEILHATEASLHTAEQEMDPCHQAIYHDIAKEGCDHETHITAVKKCPLCHVVPVNAPGIAASQSFHPSQPPLDFNDFLIPADIKEIYNNLSARAPPIS